MPSYYEFIKELIHSLDQSLQDQNNSGKTGHPGAFINVLGIFYPINVTVKINYYKLF